MRCVGDESPLTLESLVPPIQEVIESSRQMSKLIALVSNWQAFLQVCRTHVSGLGTHRNYR
jgi:hypothetical protein